jgi:acetolactate synthase-1/2/3 large subunit
MTKLSDYLIRRLADWGVRDIFMLTGGGAMHLNDSIGRESRIRYICNHHEQACAMAAESYARISGRPGVLCVTTGPGGLNALNGVFGAFTDSIPMLVVSGQVKRETCLAATPCPGLRQLGDQEAPITEIARPITKYAQVILDPQSIRYHLERAWHLTTLGRPGPCWLDIPVDVQSAPLDEDTLPPYDPAEDRLTWDLDLLRRQCREIAARIRGARRPVIMVGTGVRIAGAIEAFHDLITRLGIPVTTAWTAHDLVPSDHPLYCGRPSNVGDRPGNFAVQNSDLLLVLGSRLHIRQISYAWPSFARHAFKIQVDIDEAELRKPTVRPDLAVHADLALFLPELLQALDPAPHPDHAAWLDWCRERVRRYPVHQPAHAQADGPLNPYYFIHELFRHLEENDIIACGDGAACVVPFQAGHIKPGQRMFTNAGSASMGYDLPAAIGAAVAAPGRRVVCLAGDGSVQLNIQELQTIVHHQLPIKIFVLNNGGYLSIRSTQQSFFDGRLVGESPQSGLSFPDMVRLAQAYGIPAHHIRSAECLKALPSHLSQPGPALFEVILDPRQAFEPRSSSRVLPNGKIVSAPLEDLYPFLDREEYRANLLVPEYDPASSS